MSEPAVSSLFAALRGLSIEAVLRSAPLPSLERRVLVAHALNLSRIQLITESQRILSEDEAWHLAELFQRRIEGEPIAYIIGEREFYGLSFHVNSDVLIPRPETELLVDLTLERLPANGRVLDMGTGSGIIAIAVAHSRADAAVTALDASDAALATARHNALRHQVNVEFLQSDWYSGLTESCEKFDVIASNPPYIVPGDAHLAQGDLRFEPIDALTDHTDGLSALRAIVTGASDHLRPGGWLLMEHGYDQADAVQSLLTARNFAQVQSWADLAGIRRVTGGRKSD